MWGENMGKAKTPEEFFKDADYKSRKDIKLFILRHHLLEYKCANCGCDGNWQGGTISLELHHINFIHDDNRLENLMFLCPNCHALTETQRREELPAKHRGLYHCEKCGKPISKGARMCMECSRDLQKKFNPSREELKETLRTLPSFRQAGLFYGVSSTAITKRCQKLGLPTSKTEINSYSDSDWAAL